MTTEPPLAFASFLIYQDKNALKFWTEYFGVVPDISGMKGEPIVTPSGRVSQSLRKIGVWGISSKSTIQSDKLEPHLRYLTKRLGLPRSDLRELIDKTNAKMRFFCYWANETGDRIPAIPDDLRAMMAPLGGSIDIDEHR